MTVAAPGTNERGWLSAHLFYQGSHDLLLRELVIPLLHELRGQAALAGHFFLRHWQGGPHVRLRLRACQRHHGAVHRLLVAQARRFFARWPSQDRLDGAAYAKLAPALAAREPGVEVSTLAPNNSLQLVPYQPEHHKYGHGPALEAVERHFAHSSDLCLEVIRQDTPLRQRLVLAFAAVVAAASEDLPDWRTLAARLNQLRRTWDKMLGVSSHSEDRVLDAYRVRRAPLRSLAQAMCEPLPSTLRNAFLDGWRTSVHALTANLTAPGVTDSPAHGSATKVALDHCAHLVCNRLGVEPRNEWLVRSLACKAVLDLSETEPGGADQLLRLRR